MILAKLATKMEINTQSELKKSLCMQYVRSLVCKNTEKVTQII